MIKIICGGKKNTGAFFFIFSENAYFVLSSLLKIGLSNP